MGRNELLSQLICTIWLLLCQVVVFQKSYCFANMVHKQLIKTNYCSEDILQPFEYDTYCALCPKMTLVMQQPLQLKTI